MAVESEIKKKSEKFKNKKNIKRQLRKQNRARKVTKKY